MRRFYWVTWLWVLALAFTTSADAARRKTKVLKEVRNLLEEATIQAPVDREVCFSPEERCDLKLIRFIETAQVSVDIAVFDLNLDQLVHTLLVMAKKGVRIRVLADTRQAKGAYSLIPTLIKGGVEVRFGKQRGIMHHKFTIIDGKRLETGSFNYTNHASRANQENQIYLGDPSILARFAARFAGSWDQASRRGR